jgi:hypothetical protein
VSPQDVAKKAKLLLEDIDASYVELITVDQADPELQKDKKSFVSIVIEEIRISQQAKATGARNFLLKC